VPLAFITGGSRGLGYATAVGLKQAGFDLVLFAKDAERLGNSAATLGANFEVVDLDRKSTRLNSSHIQKSRMPSSA